MEIGLMWMDDDKKRSLPAKIERAAEFYRRKYGEQPTTCFINPRMIEGTVQMPPPAVAVVKTSTSIMMDHFWLGVDTAPVGNRPAEATPATITRAVEETV